MKRTPNEPKPAGAGREPATASRRVERPRDRAPASEAARRPHAPTKTAASTDVDGARVKSSSSSGPRRGRIIFTAGCALLVIALLVAGILYYVAESTIDDIPTASLDKDTLADAKEGEPQNFLVIGSDERPPDQFSSDAAGKRSDTLILVQVDPEASKGRVLSIPRDTRVQIPGMGTDKINAAFSRGGPQLTIKTVNNFLGVPIHHYVEIDFEGLVGLVDTLGGVDICVDQPMRDWRINVWFGQIDCYHIDGTTALGFARSRSMEVMNNGAWVLDPTADIGRIHRQQLFLKAVIKKAVGVKALGNWQEVAEGIKRGVTIDDGLQLWQFLALYENIQGFDADKVDMQTLPGHPSTIGGISYWIPDAVRSAEALRAFGADPAATIFGSSSSDSTRTAQPA